jgi:hypothetical protein
MRKALVLLAVFSAATCASYFQGFALYEQDALNEHFETDEIEFRKVELPAFNKVRWTADYYGEGFTEEHDFDCYDKNDYVDQYRKSRSVAETQITFEDDMMGGNPGESRYRAEFKCGDYQFATYTDFVTYDEFVSLMEAAVTGCNNAKNAGFLHAMMDEVEEPAPTPTIEPSIQPTVEPSPSPTPSPTAQASPTPSPEPSPSPSPSPSPTPTGASATPQTINKESDYSQALAAWIGILLISFVAVVYFNRK